MSIRQLPGESEILTRSGKIVNPLNVQDGDISILDVVHALPVFPMMGAQTKRFYSMAEHSVNMYDYFEMYCNDVITKFDKSMKKEKARENSNSIADIKKRHLRLFMLLHYAPYPFLTEIAGCFSSFAYHYPRILASIAHHIGLDYTDMKLCSGMMEYVNKEVKLSVYSSFNANSDKYLFKQPHEAQEDFICRFNKDSDVEIKTIGSHNYLYQPQFDNQGQAFLNFNLPTTAI